MNLSNLKPARGSTKNKKRIGRGQGSGTGKTAGRGNKGQKSRSGYKEKLGFEGGQQPIQRRVPKVGFTSRVQKPYVINGDKVTFLDTLEKITIEEIKKYVKMPKRFTEVKIIGKKAKSYASKIDDTKICYTNKEAK